MTIKEINCDYCGEIMYKDIRRINESQKNGWKIYCSFENNESAAMMVSDWLLSKGFDVHGLILKGLALETPEEDV